MTDNNKKAAYFTLGCKLNFSETSTIAQKLEASGFERVNFDEVADIYLINSCSVTESGDKKSRSMIRRAKRLNPNALVVVTGCYAQLNPSKIAQIEGVGLVLGMREKYEAENYIEALSNVGTVQIKVSETKFDKDSKFFSAVSYGDRTRSYLKIQDGCDYFCSYCTIPFARGRSRNANIKEIVAQAKSVTSSGIKELVITGVNIGDFGKSTNESLHQLLAALEKESGAKRIRIGSVEPNLMTDEILELMKESEVIAPHFHIPLQSGANEILKLMKRKYEREVFAERIEKISSMFDKPFIGVDIIAGMNGESDKLFEESYEFVRDLPISQIHAFPYSERPNTQALNIEHSVPINIRKERAARLIELSDRKLTHFLNENVGTTHKVLFEHQTKENPSSGLTENYIRVDTSFDPKLENQIVEVVIGAVKNNKHCDIRHMVPPSV
ncbi:MAG: tRNA (N(6)-L-threonylcarbamoyladenosine(37)-C(2))-methylthiotransferase MtaB [Bacteroidales bacterium]